MREVFTSQDSGRVGLYCGILREAGFNAFIRNEKASGGEAIIPSLYPAVCILDDDRYDEAITLIAKHFNAPAVVGADWICPQCKEPVPASFDSCWNCETVKPEALLA